MRDIDEYRTPAQILADAIRAGHDQIGESGYYLSKDRRTGEPTGCALTAAAIGLGYTELDYETERVGVYDMFEFLAEKTGMPRRALEDISGMHHPDRFNRMAIADLLEKGGMRAVTEALYATEPQNIGEDF